MDAKQAMESVKFLADRLDEVAGTKRGLAAEQIKVVAAAAREVEKEVRDGTISFRDATPCYERLAEAGYGFIDAELKRDASLAASLTFMDAIGIGFKLLPLLV